MQPTTERKQHIIHITARRWFQKTYGNTYHSVKVYIDGELVGHVPFTYGYGSQYEQTALEIIAKHLPEYGGEFRWPSITASTLGDKYTVDLSDVSRKSDLN
jgi:hypothetical protein